MINPSANGWIDKFFIEQQTDNPVPDMDAFYRKVRETGFIYGHIAAISSPKPIAIEGWLSDEISKAALLNILYQVYVISKGDRNPEAFVEQAVAFYSALHPQGDGFLRKIIPGNSNTQQLEKTIGARVHTNDSMLSKNFSHIVTNALLFVDALAFRKYLVQQELPDKYLKKIEEAVISIVTLALQSKTNKSVHDKHLVKLFEASVRYSKFSTVNIQHIEALQLDYFTDALEHYFLIDLAGLALWSDGKLENEEAYFLHALARIMGVSDAFVSESIAATDTFLKKHHDQIPYFNFSNPVKHFYDHTTQLVVTLIRRNRKRLAKEIAQSGELMVLLAQSASRELDKAEKKKVKKQLLDICKSIPSLTIFLIPGGSLLLPLLIKFIPQMLPSAFNENLEEDADE